MAKISAREKKAESCQGQNPSSGTKPENISIRQEGIQVNIAVAGNASSNTTGGPKPKRDPISQEANDQ